VHSSRGALAVSRHAEGWPGDGFAYSCYSKVSLQAARRQGWMYISLPTLFLPREELVEAVYCKIKMGIPVLKIHTTKRSFF